MVSDYCRALGDSCTADRLRVLDTLLLHEDQKPKNNLREAFSLSSDIESEESYRLELYYFALSLGDRALRTPAESFSTLRGPIYPLTSIYFL